MVQDWNKGPKEDRPIKPIKAEDIPDSAELDKGVRGRILPQVTVNVTKIEMSQRLHNACAALYDAGHWTCDRDVDAKQLWTELRDAMGREPGSSPTPLEQEPIQQEKSLLIQLAKLQWKTATKILDVIDKMDLGKGIVEMTPIRMAAGELKAALIISEKEMPEIFSKQKEMPEGW